MSRTDADTLMDAAQIKAAPIRLADDAQPFLILGEKVVPLEKFLPAPTRQRGTIRATNLEAVSAAITKYQSPAIGIAAFWKLGRLTVYLNFHGDQANAGWCDFKITCWCRYHTAVNSLTAPVLKGSFKSK